MNTDKELGDARRWSIGVMEKWSDGEIENWSIRAAVLLTIAFSTVSGQPKTKPEETTKDAVPARVTGAPTYAILNINNITSWMRYDGYSNRSPSGLEGMRYLRFGTHVIYQDGLVWGGKVFTDPGMTRQPSTHPIRIGGGTYVVGTREGRVISTGSSATPEDPNGPDVRIFRIRRDYYSAQYDMLNDAADVYETNSATYDQVNNVMAQYANDWTQWPVSRGAPFIDRNKNGAYEPPPAFNTDENIGSVFSADSLIAQGRDEPGVAGQDLDLPADQVIWTVYNDLDVTRSRTFADSEPIGLEVQKTVWGYRQSGALGNLYLVRYRFINKGGIDTSDAPGVQKGSFWIDSMYVGQWSDPDLGDWRDDLVASDVDRNMGYVYNGTNVDQDFSSHQLPPPAVAYHLAVGPTVPSPGDSALVDFHWIKGLRNIGMSSFVAWAPEDGPTDPPPHIYTWIAPPWWKALRGFKPIGDFSTPDTYFDSGPHPPGPYRFPGDPLMGSGFVDGQGTSWSPSPGDRRMMASTGPFRMAPGDTQDMVWAVIAGLSADRLTAIEVTRYNLKVLRTLLERGLKSPAPPVPPVVRAIELDREVILEWGSDTSAVRRTESSIAAGDYAFEGYTVYQLPLANSWRDEWVRIATIDRDNGIAAITEEVLDDDTRTIIRRVLQEGTDSGIKRSLRITRDVVEPYSNRPLVNGREYHFAVTAYNVSSRLSDSPISLESAPVRITVKPRIPFGMQATVVSGDTIAVEHLSGNSDLRIVPVVIDPLGGMGDRFRVSFQTVDSNLTWTIANVTASTVVRSGGTNFSGDDDYPIVDGVLVKISGPDSAGIADVFEFIIPAPVEGRAVELQGVERISVFPNPYYAEHLFASGSTTRARQFVTFSNLPQRAVIRIFNLAGHLVRTLYKDSPTQFFEWDLQNENGWLAASGMYLCYIELPDVGVSKVLKLGVVAGMEGIR